MDKKTLQKNFMHAVIECTICTNKYIENDRKIMYAGNAEKHINGKEHKARIKIMEESMLSIKESKIMNKWIDKAILDKM
jgi:hypothetical protein